MEYDLSVNKPNDKIYMGLIVENYVAHEFIKNHGIAYNYNDLKKEVDFIIYKDNEVIPVEVKTSLNTNSKNLMTFMQQQDSQYAYRVSRKNFGFHNKIKSVPLYAVHLI